MPVDYNDYPADWPERRQRILERADHSCEHCGVLNYAVIERGTGATYDVLAKCEDYQRGQASRKHYRHLGRKAILIVLTVAHLDHDEWNHQVEDNRLAALCQRCHLQYDRADNHNRKAYGKHYQQNQLRIPGGS